MFLPFSNAIKTSAAFARATRMGGLRRCEQCARAITLSYKRAPRASPTVTVYQRQQPSQRTFAISSRRTRPLPRRSPRPRRQTARDGSILCRLPIGQMLVRHRLMHPSTGRGSTSLYFHRPAQSGVKSSLFQSADRSACDAARLSTAAQTTHHTASTRWTGSRALTPRRRRGSTAYAQN